MQLKHPLMLSASCAVLLLVCFLALSGCDWICTNECPKGWVHGNVGCSSMEVAAQPAQADPTQGPPVAKDHYITRRYVCRDVSNGSDRGSCDVTEYANSCEA